MSTHDVASGSVDIFVSLLFTFAVNEAYFKENEKNNPARIEGCSQPQPRFKISKSGWFPRYIRYKQCLPYDCAPTKQQILQMNFKAMTTQDKTLNVTSDVSCSYVMELNHNTHDKGKKNYK